MVRSLRTKLFLWYIGSLTFLAAFLYIFVHEYAWVHGIHVFFGIYTVLALTGFFVVLRITRSLDNLSAKMRTITYKNLDERIQNVRGEDEISLLARTFNKLLDRLDEAFRREQQFIGDVTHELKTPLTTLRSSIELGLDKERPTEEYQKILRNVMEEINTLSSTINSILDLAWSESPKDSKDIQKVNLSQFLEEITEIAQKMAVKKKITVKSSIQQNIFTVGYKDKLGKALMNIIDNAIKYNNAHGTLSITMEQIHDKAIIIIKDSGVGIVGEDLERIFDRFYRGSRTSKVFGSGLGLAISKSIINLHRGDIKATSKVGSGATFTISLPLYR